MLEVNTYLTNCLKLAKSIHMYSTTTAKQVLYYYQMNLSTEMYGLDDSCVNPYDVHLQGQLVSLDGDAVFTSLDTGATNVPLENIHLHPTTKQMVLNDVSYRMTFIDGLGLFGYQKLQGVLHPATVPLPARDGTILYYDESLVEPHEYSLITELQEWIYTMLHRWTNSGYVASDPLYGAALNGIMYVHMVSKIVELRDKRMHTQEAHSFHIDLALADYGLSEYLSILSEYQKFKLYKDLPWLVERSGHQSTFMYYKTLLESGGRVKLLEYTTRPVVTHQVGAFKSVAGVDRPVTIAELARVTNNSYVATEKALLDGATLDALPIVQVRATTIDVIFMDLKRAMINSWGKLASEGKYTASASVALPNNAQRELTAYQAFIYYAIHRPSSKYSPAQTPDLYAMPMMQNTSGYTGEDLISFSVLQAVTRTSFPSTIEKMHRDLLLLRAAIDTTDINSRAYWEGEFPRTYTMFYIHLPDKETWLLEQDLPELTDSLLDALAEQFIGYTETTYYNQLNSEQLYADLLNKTLSMSTTVVTSSQGHGVGSFVQLPLIYAMPVVA